MSITEQMIPEVDEYLAVGCGRCSLYNTPECKVHTFPEELQLLRSIVLQSGLKEEFKWKQPCYTLDGKNVLLVTAFKNFAALAFFKGALMKDPVGLLVFAGENSQSGKQMRFTSPEEVKQQDGIIREFIKQAIEIEKKGLKVDFKQKNELEFPEELLEIFEEDPAFKNAFFDLTPGRQRGYVLHFSQPKQSATRISRIRKCIPKVFEGKGFFDR